MTSSSDDVCHMMDEMILYTVMVRVLPGMLICPPDTAVSLDTVTEPILISLYDEVLLSTVVEGRHDLGAAQDPQPLLQKIERLWLGGVEIPFATVYSNSKVSPFRFMVT
ncbi:unnamed protein product [Protopolystoma xenopodis]|uniref:Uncharacterized protein n=1 Tax=Protopolystoma xenopodis TaxID=117903 RepID=A0A448WZ73_9PLAT|nr:unnamed protein product [Protopolystoma xenopodis]